MRFSGHESFVCRYAWLPKAYQAIVESADVFLNEEQAMVRLGVGKNMVRSIRFWVEVMGVAVPRSDRSLEPTEFGNAVFGEDGFDPFLEDVRTLWLLHWNVATRIEDPLFAWDFLLYKWPHAEITRSEALAAFTREASRLAASYSEITLGQHLDVFLRTYVGTSSTRSGFEESLDCPLAELELLHHIGEHNVDANGRRETVYGFRREAKSEVGSALFEYCLEDYWRRHRPGEASLTFRDVATAPYSIGQVFKLPEDDIRDRLDNYDAPESSAPFRYQASAVQGLVYRRDVQERDLLTKVYAEELDIE